ncbi:hypothetical protein [Sphingomonas sp. PB4P5]|uniref:hypothetical protein n=1 Tax=Parasphingomonas puruogangriensis TaxID=3096155 RepID=UPI002FCC845A
MADTTPHRAADLLQDGVSNTLATLFAISASDMLNTLPADNYAKLQHGHALMLLHMLEDNLRRIQIEVDAIDDAAIVKGA